MSKKMKYFLDHPQIKRKKALGNGSVPGDVGTDTTHSPSKEKQAPIAKATGMNYRQASTSNGKAFSRPNKTPGFKSKESSHTKSEPTGKK